MQPVCGEHQCQKNDERPCAQHALIIGADDMSSLLTFCESQRNWLVETTRALVEHESPSTDKVALDACATHLQALCAQLGGRIERLAHETAGDHLLVEWGRGEQQILLLGHYDTVWPLGQLRRMPVTEAGGRLHGPGVFDMKGGLAIGLLAMRALLEVAAPGSGRVVFLMTSDEETGSHASRNVIVEQALESAAVLVLEPATLEGFVKTSRKGVGVYTIRAHGVSAHAGADPGRGASAIHELARQIVALSKLQDVDRGVSVNVGIVSGGTRSNVIAEEAWAEVDVRVPSREDAERVESFMRARRPTMDGTRIEIAGGINRMPFERTAAVVGLFHHARTVAAEMGFELGEGGAGGASDGNFTGALGIPTLDGLGALGDGAHALHEHVIINDLPRRAALLAGLIQRLGFMAGQLP